MVELISDSINTNMVGVWKYLSYFSIAVTDLTIKGLNQIGLNPSVRWASYFTLFLSLIIVYIGIKLSNPIIRVILVIFGIILFGGLMIPGW
jgi:hypothetical protein